MADLRAMLAIPRPQTRGDCLTMARPCPWVGCRHHLLLELGEPSVRSTRGPGLMLTKGTSGGRRPQLAASADLHEVEAWTDEAVRELATMPDTCALDVADRVAQQLAMVKLQRLLGRSRNQTRIDLREAKLSMKPRELELFVAGLAARRVARPPAGWHFEEFRRLKSRRGT